MRALVAITILLTLVAPAGATTITYLCGADLCRIDPRRPERIRRLTRDGAQEAYATPSVSWDGRRMAFFRGPQLFRSAGSGAHRRPLDNRQVPPDPGQALMSPDGETVASIETRLFPFGHNDVAFVTEMKGVFTYPTGRQDVIGVATAAWLGGRIAVGRDPEEDADQAVCVPAPDFGTGCERTVAADAGFDLWWPSASRDARFVVATKVIPAEADAGSYDGRIGLFNARTGRLVRDLTHGEYDAHPVFSPDGSRIAFNRGFDLFVVRTDGTDLGRPHLLLHDARRPSWSR